VKISPRNLGSKEVGHKVLLFLTAATLLLARTDITSGEREAPLSNINKVNRASTLSSTLN
jgi:hypothetical protein